MVGIAVMLVVELARGGMRDSGMIWFTGLLIAAAPAITGILRGTWMRGFAISALILALPCIAIAGFFVYAMTTESGGWHPTPSSCHCPGSARSSFPSPAWRCGMAGVPLGKEWAASGWP
jgi:hypothetical protein